MNKAIIILSGVPSGKSRFSEIAFQVAWVWAVNAKDYLAELSKKIGWDGIKDDNHYKFIVAFLNISNAYYDFEEKYLEEKIRNFVSDSSPTKSPKDNPNKVFNKFVLAIHGVSKNLVTSLKEDSGAFKVHITRRDANTNVIPESDFVLYEDDPTFEQDVLEIVNTLTS